MACQRTKSMIKLLAIAMCMHGVNALKFATTQSTFDVKGCPREVDFNMWGIWIDGRDAASGPSAYGGFYPTTLMSGLQMIYDAQIEESDTEIEKQSVESDLTLLFLKIVDSLKIEWRSYFNPAQNAVKKCHNIAMPAAQVNDIMSTVSVVADPSPLDKQGYINVLDELFANYSKAVKLNPEVEDKLYHLGVLLQNLAFLHPLYDRNGRSRLLLLQYELRQQGIACGTMMYNNNKNIYFDTVPEMVSKIKEGITMYNDAWSSGFTINPWTSGHAVESHCDNFAHAWEAELGVCWQKHMAPGEKDTVPSMSRSTS